MLPPDELEGDHKRSTARRVALTAVGVVAALILLAVALSFALRPAPPAGDAGRRAPDFELPFLTRAGTLSSEELKGTPVVLNLWASWCIPCREEAPALEAMWRKYKDRIVIVGVNVRDREEAAREFAREFGLTYPLVRDEDRALERALQAFGLPETYFIDHRWRFLGVARGGEATPGARGGNVYLGGISEEELEANIEALLAAKEAKR